MIFLTRMDKQVMYLNPDHIISIEETPDTVIALFNGNHFIVKERARVIIERIIAFRSRIIRRSSSSLSYKTHNRNKQNLYKSPTLNNNKINIHDQTEQTSSPFHYRDN